MLAGAGTGKTRTLVARAAWLRGGQGGAANRILLLTFTRRAASDMLARAAAGCDGPDPQIRGPERICGGTFHAIAHKIIRQHAEALSLPPQFTILYWATPLTSWTSCDRITAWPRHWRHRQGRRGRRPARISTPGA